MIQTVNQQKYAELSKPMFWTTNVEKVRNSMFKYMLDEETIKYYLNRLEICNGFLGWFGKRMYYIPEEDVFRIVRKLSW